MTKWLANEQVNSLLIVFTGVTEHASDHTQQSSNKLEIFSHQSGQKNVAFGSDIKSLFRIILCHYPVDNAGRV